MTDDILSFSFAFSDPVLNYYHYVLQTVYGDYTFTLPSKFFSIYFRSNVQFDICVYSGCRSGNFDQADS